MFCTQFGDRECSCGCVFNVILWSKGLVPDGVCPGCREVFEW